MVAGDAALPTVDRSICVPAAVSDGLDYTAARLTVIIRLATSVPNLHFISAGDMPMVEMGSFSGMKLREILSDLKLRYDLVLLDAPPVLGISEGSVIAHEVDACILVIQHRRYPRDISLRAKRAIEEVKGNLIGVVLNAVAIQSDEAYYYYSSYGNYYYKDGSKPTPSRKETQVKTARARMAAS